MKKLLGRVAKGIGSMAHKGAQGVKETLKDPEAKNQITDIARTVAESVDKDKAKGLVEQTIGKETTNTIVKAGTTVFTTVDTTVGKGRLKAGFDGAISGAKLSLATGPLLPIKVIPMIAASAAAGFLTKKDVAGAALDTVFGSGDAPTEENTTADVPEVSDENVTRGSLGSKTPKQAPKVHTVTVEVPNAASPTAVKPTHKTRTVNIPRP